MAPNIKERGFTLIELILVSAIIGLLASIAIPKFADLIVRAKEASVKGKLGSLRSAITIYYSDTEGIFPSKGYSTIITVGTGSFMFLPVSLVPKYIDKIPSVSLPANRSSNPPNTNAHFVSGYGAADNICDFPSVSIVGGPAAYEGSVPYFYNPLTGFVGINCPHSTSQESSWDLQ